MTTPAIILNILFILCLTSPVVTRSVGLIKSDDKPAQKLLIPLMFGITQGVAVIIGYNLGRLMAHLFNYVAEYMVFVMMLVVAVKMFVDSMRVLKGKMLYTVQSDWDILGLSVLAAMNTLLMSLMGFCFMPFGLWFILAVVVAGFLWAFFIVRVEFAPSMIKKLSFIEFSASVFMLVIAILYLLTDLI
jgi:putative Mn2+ efflux pump MntP